MNENGWDYNPYYSDIERANELLAQVPPGVRIDHYGLSYLKTKDEIPDEVRKKIDQIKNSFGDQNMKFHLDKLAHDEPMYTSLYVSFDNIYHFEVVTDTDQDTQQQARQLKFTIPIVRNDVITAQKLQHKRMDQMNRGNDKWSMQKVRDTFIGAMLTAIIENSDRLKMGYVTHKVLTRFEPEIGYLRDESVLTIPQFEVLLPATAWVTLTFNLD